MIRLVIVVVAKYIKLRNIRKHLVYYLLLITAAALHVKMFRRSSTIDAITIDAAATNATAIGTPLACGFGGINGFCGIHSFGINHIFGSVHGF